MSKIIQEKEFIEFLKKSVAFGQYKLQTFISRNRRVRLYTYKNNIKNRFTFDAPPHPYRPIWVKARNISFLVSDRKNCKISKPHYGGFGQVEDGEWPNSNHIVQINNHVIKKGFIQRYIDGQEWEKTSYYDYLTKKEKYNKKEIYNKLNNLDDLYQSISSNGYQPGHAAPNHEGDYGYKDKLEPLVVIDPKGEIYLWDGRHRFCIAQILDLKIPVHVVCRHSQWQKLRDDVCNNGLSTKHEWLQNHPDLLDILNHSCDAKC